MSNNTHTPQIQKIPIIDLEDDNTLTYLKTQAMYDYPQEVYYNMIAQWVMYDNDTDILMSPEDAGWL